VIGLALVAVMAVAVGVELHSAATALTTDTLVMRLHANGETVANTPVPISDDLLGTHAISLELDGEVVLVYEYAVPLTAQITAGHISRDGSTITNGFGPWQQATIIDWIAPPHFYTSGRVIVRYVGANAAVLRALARALRPQFASGA
jgi:hypothetical protein